MFSALAALDLWFTKRIYYTSLSLTQVWGESCMHTPLPSTHTQTGPCQRGMKWLVAKPRLETTLNARTGVPVKAQLKYPERELGEISAISARKYSTAIREFRGGNQKYVGFWQMLRKCKPSFGFTLRLIKLLKCFPKCSRLNTSSIESTSCMLAR